MTSTTPKLLIIGGYGTFGGRLARLLADEPRLTILIAGRSLRKAEQFVAGNPGRATLVPVIFDRDAIVLQQIRDLSPTIVVDASGPFQAYGSDPYRVVAAAIACGAHYVDLADGSSFVHNICAFDAAAKKENIFVLSGASTCPVLTVAVAQYLCRGLTAVDSITGGIAPSPYAGLGLSVVQAIAEYAGKPVMVQRDNRQVQSHALTESRRFTIAPPGHLPLPPRTFSLLDVPDLKILTELEPQPGSVWFGVATVPAIYLAVLRLLARCVKTGIFRSLKPLAKSMHYCMNHLRWGEHRGGMFIEVHGTNSAQDDIIRSWHLVAEGDDGPMIPALAGEAIIRKCLADEPPAAGARPASGLLTLDDYQPMLRRFNIVNGSRESPLPSEWPLFRQVLANAWYELPGAIRDLHNVDSHKHFSGMATVTRGRSPLARISAWFIGFPAAGDEITVNVQLRRKKNKEQWRRDFAGHTFSSEMTCGNGYFSQLICERFGPFKFGMGLVVENESLHYVPRRWSFLGVPMPKGLAPRGRMVESINNGRFNFHVEVVLPIIGHLVTYQGWLTDHDQVAVNS